MAEPACDGDGMCLVCKVVPPDSQVILCNSCGCPWHMACFHPPISSVPDGEWFCPDCNPSSAPSHTPPVSATLSGGDDLVRQIRAIQADPTMSEQEKARKCQDIMSKKAGNASGTNGNEFEETKHNMLKIFDENLNCIFCMQLADRPVTTPCGHNFCLKCFQRWIAQGKKDCGKCRAHIPAKMASQPRINSALVAAIRMAKNSIMPSTNGPAKPYVYIQNQDRPDKCFTSERAKKSGKANASSGKIFVTVPPDHFGPITAENDPVRGQGILVGETWEDRLECRQWGAHLPHVAGIAGQSEYGAQSVALSGGYEDDEDHGEWFLYTGSGGRDLSGNKRTNDKQSFDQKFDKSNLALKVSCKRGYPVRVVRSHKEKRSSYAPENGVRYDGIYRIEKCWRKNGIQGFKVCRYLFVRCDNEPAPWTSDQIGDRPRSLPMISELKDAVDVTERKSQPAWDWKEEEGVWGWVASPPASRKAEEAAMGNRHWTKRPLSVGQRLLKEFGCGLCKKVLNLPLSTPCGHNFCKPCLVSMFSGQKDVRERVGVGGRSLRAQKVIKRCPCCQADITEFLQYPQVNRQMEDVIQSLKRSAEGNSDEEHGSEKNGAVDASAPDVQEGEGRENGHHTSVSEGKCNGSGESSDQTIGLPTEIGNGTIRKTDPEKDKEFLGLCGRFPDYSEELLHSMLVNIVSSVAGQLYLFIAQYGEGHGMQADQDGDVKELEGMLKALKKQEKKSMNKKHGEKQGGKNNEKGGEEEEKDEDKEREQCTNKRNSGEEDEDVVQQGRQKKRGRKAKQDGADEEETEHSLS